MALARFFSRRILLADRLLHATPEGFGLEARDVSFPSRDGVTLRGWLLPGAKRGTIVLCSGNGLNVSAHIEYARTAAATGYSVLGFDYRGFGRSDGEPDLRRIAADALAACSFARSLEPSSPVGLFGLSLGAGASLEAAARGGACAAAVEGVSDIGWMLRGLLRDGSFGPVRIRSIEEPDGTVRPRERIRLVRYTVGAPIAACLAPVLAAFFPLDAKSLPGAAAGLGSTPVLIVHGMEDLLLPFEGALDLCGLLRGPRSVWLIRGCGHAQEPILCASAEYARRLGDFFDAAFSGRGSAGSAGGARLGAREDAGGRLRLRLDAGAPYGNGDVDVSPVDPDAPGPDDRAARYRDGGYRCRLRSMTQAVNQRDLAALDRALGEYMELERSLPFDFIAALQCVAASRAALGRSLDWPARDRDIARRSLERLLRLREAHPCLPGAGVESSASAWAERELRSL